MMTRDEAEAAARKGAKVRHESWNDDEWITGSGDHLVDSFDAPWNRFPLGHCSPDVAAIGWSIVEPTPTSDPGTVLPLSEWGDPIPHDGTDICPVPGDERVKASGMDQPSFSGSAAGFRWRNVTSYRRLLSKASHDEQAPVERNSFGDFVENLFKPVEPDLAARVAVSVFDEPATAPNRDSIDDLAARVSALESAQNDRTQEVSTFRTSRKPDAPGDDELLDDILAAVEPLIRPGHHHSWQMRADKDFIRTVEKVIELTRQSVKEQLTSNEERAVKAGFDVYRKTGLTVSPTAVSAIRAALAAIREGL